MAIKNIEQQDHQGNTEHFFTNAGIVKYSNANMTNVSNVKEALDYINENFASHTGTGVKKGSGVNSVVSVNAEAENSALKGAIALGNGVEANNYGCALGKFNELMNGSTLTSQMGTVLVVGNGTSDANRSNALKLTMKGNLNIAGIFDTGNADFAEMYEWLDGNVSNEDRRGRFVTFEGNKIRYAQAGDDIDGLTSAAPCLVGDNADYWHGKYVTDVFGAIVYETVIDDDGVESYRKKISPDYDPTKAYIPRSERPEYSYVSMAGKVVVVDDGTCEVGKRCNVSSDGIGTISDKGWKVLERIDSNHVLVHFFMK